MFENNFYIINSMTKTKENKQIIIEFKKLQELRKNKIINV